MSVTGNKYGSGSFKKLAWGIDQITVEDFTANISKKGNGVNLNVSIRNEEGAYEKYVSLGWLPILVEESELKTSKDLPKLYAERMVAYKYATDAYLEVDGEEKKIYNLKSEEEKKAARASVNAARTEYRKKYKYLGLVESLVKFEKFCTGFGVEATNVINSYEFKGDVIDLVNTYLSAIKDKSAYVFLATSESKSKDGNRVFTNVTLSPNLNISNSWKVESVESVEDVTKEDEAGDIVKTGVKVYFKDGKNKTILIAKDNCLKLEVPKEEQSDSEEGYSMSQEENDDLPF